jgi:MFS family permease
MTEHLAESACLVRFGCLANRVGLRRVYIAGAAIFGVSSKACSFASEAWTLILLRVVQGVGAVVSATSVALIGFPLSGGGRSARWAGRPA